MKLANWLLVVVLLAGGPAFAGADDETGPNFDLPADTAADVAAQYRRGVAAYKAADEAKSGQTEKINLAIKELKQVQKLAPKLAQPCYYLGILYQWTKEFDKARAILVKACELNPRFHQAVVELGDTYCWLKQVEKGIAEYDRAIAMKADYVHAYAMRGSAKLRLGEIKAAVDDFEAGKRIAGLAKNKGGLPPGKGAGSGPAGPTSTASAPTGATQTAGTGVRGEDDEPVGDEPWLDYGLALAKRELAGPGWATMFTCETDHYRVMTPVSQEFADDLGKHAELIFKTYTRIFPKIDKAKRKFNVIVYATREDYHEGGGPPSAAGHYDPLIRKLVFYKGKTDADTKIVLYHEGFHQFLHDYLEKAPQWFNEGLGDFFGPSRYVPGKGKAAGGMQLVPNPWRLQYIQSCIRAGKFRHFRELMLMSQKELYDPAWIGIHYAQSWSVIYFLVRGGAGPNDEAGPYFKILTDYFKALRKGDGQESAFEAAFGRCDLKKLEDEWRSFTLGLKP